MNYDFEFQYPKNFNDNEKELGSFLVLMGVWLQTTPPTQQMIDWAISESNRIRSEWIK